jgi:hypothetical protein
MILGGWWQISGKIGFQVWDSSRVYTLIPVIL